MPFIILLLIATLANAQENFGEKYQTLLTELHATSFENRDKAHEEIQTLAIANPELAAKSLLNSSKTDEDPETRKRTASILRNLYHQKFTPPAPGYLGIRHGQTEIKIDGQRVNGALILTVMDNTPAAKAGLQVGDAIIAVAETDFTKVPIAAMRDAISKTIKDKKAGQTVPITVWRKGKKITVKATLAPYINEFEPPENVEKLYQQWLQTLKPEQPLPKP